MVTCELCGKELKNTQGLRGHKTFIHGITGSSTEKPVTQVATEQQISLLEDRLQQLERVTGLRESDLYFSLSVTEPLTDRLTNITEQVTKLSDKVSKLSEDIELVQVSRLAKTTVQPTEPTELTDEERFESLIEDLTSLSLEGKAKLAEETGWMAPKPTQSLAQTPTSEAIGELATGIDTTASNTRKIILTVDGKSIGTVIAKRVYSS